ncbi:unnamed protein product [Cladocopium goreaui]|uniref:Uncharacterized protein n=1 Tax=Cladocopium goreaui TaxID=2562237 RepID=A0A9P1CRS9_9DINO|nr:unnamed protein product [Cladocopium goreaui]
MMDEVERGFKEKYEDLQKTLMESRRQYLAELSEHRDRMRSETLSPPLQAALAEISEEDADHHVYRFQPEMALDPLTQEYFKAAMIENMKVALTKGAAAAGETIQLLMNQLKEAQTESDRLREQLEDALLQAMLAEGSEKRAPAPPRRPSAQADPGEAKKLQAEIEALKQELDGNKRDMERHRGIFQIFGLDPDCSLEVARKFFETLTAQPPADDSASEVDQLKAKNAALLKQQKTLEEEIQKLKRLADESSKKLQAQVKELQEENEKLKSQLSTKTLPPGPEKKKDDGKKEADLQRQLDLLKKQLTDATKGNDAMAKLMKRNEDLEAEVAQLKEELKVKTREATESTQAADFARRQSTDLMAQMEQMRKQLDDAKKELDDERRRSSVKVPVERPSSEEDRQLQDKLKRTKDENENLKQENKQLRDALDEAKIMRKALEQAMDELKRKFEEFKKKLQEKGVDVSLLDEALLEVGMPSHPMNVFDRLYQDAVRRFNRFQEKWVIDMKNAQQETWERILGIYDGPPLTKEQVTALVQNGLIDIRRFAFDEPPSRMICPKCGYNLRSGTPDRPRPHSQPSESQRPRFGRMKTWAGSMAGSLSPKGGGNQPDVFARQDIYLDIVGFQPHQAQDRKPFAIVSEADQYMHHCHLQRFEPLSLSADADASAVGREMTPSKMETPKGATPSPSPCAKDGKTPKTPKLVTLESAMSMDLDDREVMVVSAPSPVNMEPPAPPVTQRRISTRDAKLVEGAALVVVPQRLFFLQ